jgi:hypothetical protein
MKIIYILALIPLAWLNSAPLKIKISGTANNTARGFVQGQLYSFTFIVNDEYSGGSGDVFVTTENKWSQKSITDPTLFNNIVSDSLVGAFTPTFDATYSAYEMHIIEERGKQELWLTAEAEGSDIGLKTPDGSPISDFAVEIIFEGFSIPYSQSFVNPTELFSSYYQSFEVSESESWFDFDLADGGWISFKPTQLSMLPIYTYVDVDIHTSIEITFATTNDAEYTIETSTDFSSWETSGESIAGDGSNKSLHFTTREEEKQFFRVRETMPTVE